jgi:hypothetical protein
LGTALRQSIQARFAASNELVRRDYFPDRALLFAPGEENGPEQPGPALSPTQEALLDEVIGMLAQAIAGCAPQNAAECPAARPKGQAATLAEATLAPIGKTVVVRP